VLGVRLLSGIIAWLLGEALDVGLAVRLWQFGWSVVISECFVFREGGV
jgi:hypothetical protein